MESLLSSNHILERHKVKEVLHSPDCFGITALCVALRQFGWEAHTWIPDTIIQRLEEEYDELPLTTLNKLFAALTVLTTDYYWTRPNVFIVVTNSLSTGVAEDEAIICDFLGTCWAIQEANLIFPPDPQILTLSGNVLEYIKQLGLREGYLRAPKHLWAVGVGYDESQTALSAFAADPEFYRAIVEVQQEILGQLEADLDTVFTRLLDQLTYLGFNNDIIKTDQKMGINI